MHENLINNMMELSKLENNQFKLNNEIFSLPHLIYDVLTIMHPVA